MKICSSSESLRIQVFISKIDSYKIRIEEGKIEGGNRKRERERGRRERKEKGKDR